MNYFDTAWPYHRGVSEIVIGKALQRYPRKSYFLADKMPTFLMPTLAQAKEIFEKQLEKCNVEYFDYYLLHAIQSVEAYQTVYEKNGVLEYLFEEKEKGRIRNLGWSFHGNAPTLEYLLSRNVEWDFAMWPCAALLTCGALRATIHFYALHAVCCRHMATLDFELCSGLLALLAFGGWPLRAWRGALCLTGKNDDAIPQVA